MTAPDPNESFLHYLSKEYPLTAGSIKTFIGSVCVAGAGEIVDSSLMTRIGIGVAIGAAILTPLAAYRETRY
jgi:hypothetical protein